MDERSSGKAYRGKAVEGFQQHLAKDKMTARKPNKNEAFQISIELLPDDPRWHRVVNQYGRERYSVGVFANPDYDTVIKPLPTCIDDEHPPKFETMNSGEALLYLYSRVWLSPDQPEKRRRSIRTRTH